MNGLIAYLLSKGYTDNSIAGTAGALAGKNCKIQGITTITGGHRVTFEWTDDDGNSRTDTMDVMDGAQGIQGPKGDVGERGATGSKGDTATVRVGTVTSGESPSVTNVGTNTDAVFNFVLAKGDRGEQGLPGEDGQDGKSFDIKAQYPTYDALIAAHPTGEAGDAYFVGTDENPDLYIWLTDDNEWFNNGKIAGVKGDKGDTGESGFSPVASVSKVGKVATITIRDKVGQTTATVSDGEDGEDAQFEALPTASATNEGKICQYIGATSGSLVNGHFYQCVNQSGTFVWVEKFGSAIDKDYTDNVRPDSHDLVESMAVYSAINNALSSVYTARGDITVAELTSSLLIEANVGNVYELSDSGVTTDLFLQGAGVPLAVGDNVGIIKAGANTYLFNKMAGAFDLTDYQKKDLTTAVEGQTTVEGALGALSSGKVSTALVPSDASASNKLTTREETWIGRGVLSTATDLNTITIPGCYDCPDASLLTNAPSSAGRGKLINFYGGNNTMYFSQMYRNIDDGGTWVRSSAGTWSSWQKLVTESELNDVFRVYEYTSSNAPTKASFLTLLASSNAHMDFKFMNVVTDYMPNSSSYWYVQKFGGMDALHIRLLATDWVSGDLYTGDANSGNNTITWWRLAGTQV